MLVKPCLLIRLPSPYPYADKQQKHKKAIATIDVLARANKHCV
jgi:hypothetical protein